MKTFFLISFLIQFLFSYNIFSHSQDFRISSSSYTASIDNHKKIYNFFNSNDKIDMPKFIELNKDKFSWDYYISGIWELIDEP